MAAAVPAEINHGRWIAKCPFCAGAELVRPGEAMVCHSCGNQANDGQPVRVEWPRNHMQIEAVLAGRPELNRNWLPGETVKDLMRENADRGVA